MREALSVWRLAVFVGFRVVAPQLLTRRRVERRNLVVRRAQVEHVVDHERRILKRAGARAELWQDPLVGLPLPRDGEPRDIGSGDLIEWRIVRGGLVGGIVLPLLRVR